DQIRQEHEPPAFQLRAVAEIEIFGERIVLPAARVIDRLAPPHAGGAVEIEEAAGAIAAAMLQDEVGVQQNRLNLGQQRVVAIEVTPARLHHPDLLVLLEMSERAHEE